MERDKINSFSPHDIAPRAIPLVDDPLDDCTRSDLHCQMEPYSVLTAESYLQAFAFFFLPVLVLFLLPFIADGVSALDFLVDGASVVSEASVTSATSG